MSKYEQQAERIKKIIKAIYIVSMAAIIILIIGLLWICLKEQRLIDEMNKFEILANQIKEAR
jgi:hypothetical protein